MACVQQEAYRILSAGCCNLESDSRYSVFRFNCSIDTLINKWVLGCSLSTHFLKVLPSLSILFCSYLMWKNLLWSTKIMRFGQNTGVIPSFADSLHIYVMSLMSFRFWPYLRIHVTICSMNNFVELLCELHETICQTFSRASVILYLYTPALVLMSLVLSYCFCLSSCLLLYTWDLHCKLILNTDHAMIFPGCTSCGLRPSELKFDVSLPMTNIWEKQIQLSYFSLFEWKLFPLERIL